MLRALNLMDMRLLATIWWLLPLVLMHGQADSSVLVTKNFKFKDGLYLSFSSFQNNKPDHNWVSLQANSVINPENYTVKIDWIKLKDSSGKLIPMDSIWGLSVNGIPYIQVDKEVHAFGYFSALRVRGKICYFTFETKHTELVEIAAYNPLTGRPYQQAKVPRSSFEDVECMLDFETGEIQRFNIQNFKKWIIKDDNLLQTVNDISEDELSEKLFKCLLIYDDRNPVYIRSFDQKSR